VESLNQVIKEYGYIVKIAVSRTRDIRLPAMIDKSDLEQEGYIELMRCLRDYRNDGQAKFSTYASKCISNQIKNRIQGCRWGPSPSEVSRRQKAGKRYIQDMLSYDSFDDYDENGRPRVWLNEISDKTSAWSSDKIQWRDRELLLKIKISCYKSLTKDKYNGVYFEKRRGNKKEGYRIEVTISGFKLRFGKFPDREEAAQHKQDVIRSIIETIDYELLYAS